MFDKQELGFLLNLKNSFSKIDEKFYENNMPEINRAYSNIMKPLKAKAKLSNCFYCNLKSDGFCNSHSVPKCFLKNIAINGKMYFSNTLINLPFLGQETGLNETGTFHLICRDCDSKIFAEYENPDNYNSRPTQKMLAQIAMKSFLKQISKRYIEANIYDMAANINKTNFIETQSEVTELDLSEYKSEYEYAKGRLTKTQKLHIICSFIMN